MSTMISRDPFARQELHRVRVYARFLNRTQCDFCGQELKSKSAHLRHYLYRYMTITDGGTTHVHTGHFCSKSCHDSYHG